MGVDFRLRQFKFSIEDVTLEPLVCTHKAKIKFDRNYHSIKRLISNKEVNVNAPDNVAGKHFSGKFNNENNRFAADLTEEFILFLSRAKYVSNEKMFSNRLACENLSAVVVAALRKIWKIVFISAHTLCFCSMMIQVT